MYENCITLRKDGRYMGRFQIGRNENGKVVYQYVYGNTYEEAETKLKIARQVEILYNQNVNVTVEQGYSEWIAAARNRVKESSYSNYVKKFEKHILPKMGDKLCAEINAVYINSFIKEKLDLGLSECYVHDIIVILKSMLKYVNEEHGLSMNLRSIKPPKFEKKPVIKLDEKQQSKLLTYLKGHMDRTALGILLSLCMGLRVGEVCGLKWSDIDLKRRVLHVNRTVQRICVANGGKKTKIIISTPKSKHSVRPIAIPAHLTEYLKRFKDNDDHFVLSSSDKPIEPRTMQNRYKRIIIVAATEHSNYHQLRHTFATNCAEKGFDAKLLSIILGHSSVNTTFERYIHPSIQHQKRMMNKLCLRL